MLTAHALRHNKDYAARLAEYGKQFPAVAKIAADAKGRFVPSRTFKIASLCGRGKRTCQQKTASRGQIASARNWDSTADAIINTYRSGQYDSAVAMLDQRQAKRKEPRGLSVIRGWALFHNGDWDGAKRVFANLDGGVYSKEREEGLRVIELSYTRARLR